MPLTLGVRRPLQCWKYKAVICHSDQHWRGGHLRTSIRSKKRNIAVVLLISMSRLRLSRSTAHHMREADKSNAQPKDDNLTEHYEFNWCLRSPLGGRLLMQSVTQYHHDVPTTRREEHAPGNSPLSFLLTAFGVCFGKAAIIRPRAPPRDDKL